MKTAVCVLVKNEENNFLEWLCFHLAVGFDTVLVYDNHSTDRTREIARSARAVGDIRIKLWKTVGRKTQLRAYADALKAHRDEFDWIAFIDSDEFLFAPDHRPIKAVLRTLGHAGAVAVHWQCFGSSGARTISNKLLIYEFVYRAEHDFGANRHIKTIVRPRFATGECSPHHFVLGDGEICVRPDGLPIDDYIKPGKTHSVRGTDILRINHYHTRSREQYEKRLTRGSPSGRVVEDDFALMDRNDVFDDQAMTYFDEVTALMERVRQADSASA